MATEVPYLPLSISESSLKILSETDNPTKTRLSFTKATGIFKGFFYLPFGNSTGVTKKITATYAGVLLPGWVGAEGCDLGCGPLEADLPLKPFGMGAYWFKDALRVESGSRTVMVPFNAGYPLIIEKAAE